MTHLHPEKRKKDKPVCGVGINDAEFPISYVDHVGKRRLLPSYRHWKHMLGRCYSEKRPLAYRDCSVCDEWIGYSAFHRWFEKQCWQVGYHLDKDILIPGNRVYRPAACAFVSPQLNAFVNDRASFRGKYLIGACWSKQDRKFVGRCCNPFTGKLENIGYFDSELEAHLAWKNRKHELARQYAETVADPRVAAALMIRYRAEFRDAA